MQSIRLEPKKDSKPQRSVFSCNVYQTNNDRTFVNRGRFQATSASGFQKNPEVLYVNRNILDKKLNDLENLRDSGTQTSKTVLQLAQMEYEQMSPDSLNQSPRDCDKGDFANDCRYSFFDQYSEYTLDGSCSEQDLLMLSKKNLAHLEACAPPPNSYENVTDKINRLGRTLTRTFLERTNNTTNNRSSLRSKSLVHHFTHPNYINEPVEKKQANVKIIPVKSEKHTKRNKTCLYLPDNSFGLHRSSTLSYETQTFMSPTTASLKKSILPDIQSISHLIPPTRRGRSTSPRIPVHKNLVQVKQIPYIDQSRTQFNNETILTSHDKEDMKNARCKKKHAEEDTLQVDKFSVNLKTSVDSVSSNIDTISSIDSTISLAISKFKNMDWNISLRGLAEIVELCRLVDTDVMYHHMTNVYQRLIDLLKSPRSYVCRTACQATGHIFEYIKDTRRPEFDDIVDLLLSKTADANKFIRKDANMALDCMVTHVSTFHSVRALCSKGPFHKNPLVRIATVRLLVCVVVIAGTETILSPSNSEYTRKRLFANMMKFMEDKNHETRRFAERLYKILSKDPRFEIYLKKYLDKEQLVMMKRILKLIKK